VPPKKKKRKKDREREREDTYWHLKGMLYFINLLDETLCNA
jgi:hypothetical protein